MRREDLLTSRQLLLLSWCALLSPLIRQTPLAIVRIAGRYAWISALLSALPLLGMLWLMRSLLKHCPEGEGLGEQYLRALGQGPGKLVLGFSTLWILFYSGFVLRSGADRFIATVYPDSGSAGFIFVMAGLGLMAGLGRLKTLGRFAEILAPILIGLFLLLLPGILSDVEWTELGDLRKAEPLVLLRGSLPAADTIALAALGGFAAGSVKHQPCRGLLTALFGTVGLTAVLCVCAVGVFGETLTARLYYPFFVLLRNVRPLHLPERVEPLLIAQWVATDFLLFSLLLHIALRNMKLCFGGSRFLRLGLALGFSAASAFLCADSSFALIRLAASVMPIGNAILLFGVLPFIWCVGKLRHTI